MRNVALVPVVLFAPFFPSCVAPLTDAGINPERPGFLVSTSCVREGETQLEVGLPAVDVDKEAGTTTKLLSTPIAVRYGYSNGFELRASSSGWNRVSGGGTSESGIGDVELGVKYAIPAGFDSLQTALVASVHLPTGQDPFTSDDFGASAVFVVSQDTNSGFGAGAIAGYNVLFDDANTDFFTFAASLYRSLGTRWSAYVEGAVFPADGNDPAYGGGGLSFRCSDSLVLDASFDVGLNDSASDYLAGLGFSTRIGRAHP